MQAYEFKTKANNEGKIQIPPDILKKLKKNQKIKLIIMTEEANDKEAKIKAIDELSHFFDDTSEEKLKEFDQIISEKVNFSRNPEQVAND